MGKYENDKLKVPDSCQESNDLYFHANIRNYWFVIPTVVKMDKMYI